MEIIKSNLFFIASLAFVIAFLLILSKDTSKTIVMNDLTGVWEGYHKYKNITLKVDEHNKCLLLLKSIQSSEEERFNGYCEIDKSKSPYSFIMNNINELNTSLYSIVILVNQNTFYLSEFSPKWKLRPVSLTSENRIIFKKI